MKYLISWILLAIALYFIVGCDKIDAPYKEKANVGAVGTDVARTDTINVPNQQNVLIEDFTGFKCGNCPAASDVAENLEKTYKGQVFPMKIHVTQVFAAPTGKYPYEYRTPEGNEIDATFGISSAGIPTGMVNRMKVDGNRNIRHDNWGRVAQDNMKLEPTSVIRVHAMYDAEKSEINIQTQINYLKDGSLKERLVLYVLEDGIESVQIDYREGTEAKPYTHTHMLRGAVNGTFGNFIIDMKTDSAKTVLEKTGSFAKGTREIFVFTYTPRSEIKPLNCRILAVILDDETQDVIQVQEAKVVAK